MNTPIPVPFLGFRPTALVAEQKEDLVRTRMVLGNDSNLLPVPGLRSVERVRFRGGELPLRIVHEFPLDPAMKNTFAVEARGCQIIADIPGEEYLERSIYSNDGRWQDGQPFWITGEWDEEVNPPALILGAPPETVRRPFVTTGPAEMSEVARGAAARRAKAESAEASS